ncbi:Sulfotransferase domain protein [Planktothrix tepida]|uniref:Sulfotransferase domain protein n=1 Tax=Planktothrix tepida PCC 9214 TaxID=671072 RepID=A0A1J1LGX7_9CYAN|nr:sulfotransferase [Planktothrix tepida]CAD5933445.1 Sulfotransferase domain protein [Planktothrix tepida]CUR31731.1 Sulfotransferase domain protein [Planktothrix tepida PCC 9214]
MLSIEVWLPLKPFYPRLFLVGCPRSGTTLLQSLLAAHSKIASFPESHFFPYLLGNRSSWRAKLRIPSPLARKRFNQFLAETGHPELKRYLPKTVVFNIQYIQGFIRVLDELTQQQKKKLWLEKTPGNLYYISYIEKRVAGAKFIHLVRQGTDVVSSLYDVTHQYPDDWKGAWNLDRCIRRWIKDVRLSYQHLHKPNHILVQYEQLIENQPLVLAKLCEFIGVDYEPKMLQNYQKAAKKVTLPFESWKVSVQQGIYNPFDQKFHQLFNEEQKQYILQELSEANFEFSQKLARFKLLIK